MRRFQLEIALNDAIVSNAGPAPRVDPQSSESGTAPAIVRAHVPSPTPSSTEQPRIAPWRQFGVRAAPPIRRLGDKAVAWCRPAPVPFDVEYWSKAIQSYVEATAVANETRVGPSDHRAVLRELLGEMQTGIPFPVRIVQGDPSSSPAHDVVDVEPHEFQIAKLIDRLQWITRLHLVKGGGSATKRPELFASRGRSGLLVGFLRSVQSTTGLSAAVVQSGSCGESASLSRMLAQSLDAVTLQEMGISVELSNIWVAEVADFEKDHGYVVMNNMDTSLVLRPVAEGTPGLWRFSDTTDMRSLWSCDSHQLYPMVSRFDRSTYNDLDHTNVMRWSISGAKPPEVNLAHSKLVREEMTRRLGLGEDGLAKTLSEDFRRQKRIRSKFVDGTVLQQNVSHHAQVDTSLLGPAQRQKFERKVSKIEREVERKTVKTLFREHKFDEHWIGLSLPENPATVYRCRSTGELLAPTVPSHYLARTERIRWAHETWKRLRPEIAALDHRGLTLRRTRFEIPSAVEAIETLPFLGVLAGARALNFSHNGIHAEMLQGYGQAFDTLSQWIERMSAELVGKPETVDKIYKVGLGEEVRESLSQVRHNLQAFADLMNRFSDEAMRQPADEALKSRIDEVRGSVLGSPAWNTIDTIIAAPWDSARRKPARPA